MAIINTETIIVLFCTLSLEFIFLSTTLSRLLNPRPAHLKRVTGRSAPEGSEVLHSVGRWLLGGVVGLSQEELFLWLPVRDITVDDPGSGLILFDIGVAHKQLSLSLFEYPPNCKPRGELKNHARKKTGFEADQR
ncbi:hypothetical protein OIU78_025210 [Salix suchowensis]|nr:hypothetical protein OIU78_025210 [Salix suchowensis]